MSDELRNLYVQFVNHSEEERVALARDAAGAVFSFLATTSLSKEEQLDFFVKCVALFVSADRLCSESEYKLFKAIFDDVDFTYEEFFNLTNGGADPNFVEALDELIDSMPAEAKTALCVLGLTFLASDDNLTPDEPRLFEKIIG